MPSSFSIRQSAQRSVPAISLSAMLDFCAPCFTAAGFRDIETFTETRRYPFPSFGAYFKSIEEGQGEPGQAFVTLPTAIQRLVREDVRRQLEGNAVTGGPVEVEVELQFACGRR